MLARAADLAEERDRRQRARNVIERWNRELALSDLPLWSPSIRAAMIAGMPWLEILCPACATVGAVNLSLIDRHPEAGVASLVLGLTCSRARTPRCRDCLGCTHRAQRGRGLDDNAQLAHVADGYPGGGGHDVDPWQKRRPGAPPRAPT
jgi:hypothetical protein